MNTEIKYLETNLSLNGVGDDNFVHFVTGISK